MWERDGSYHQGPVWAWLLGHYALADYRVRGDAQRRRLLDPMRDHLLDAGLGTSAKSSTVRAAHAARGPSQAWSVACTLEAWWRFECETRAAGQNTERTVPVGGRLAKDVLSDLEMTTRTNGKPTSTRNATPRAARGRENWRLWGPYLAERAWGTVREDYSAGGTAWEYFDHDQARSRAYRWNEDGLGGICDERAASVLRARAVERRDPILKERAFGLTGNQGNHGEDVKEYYFYLDATPSHS